MTRYLVLHHTTKMRSWVFCLHLSVVVSYQSHGRPHQCWLIFWKLASHTTGFHLHQQLKPLPSPQETHKPYIVLKDLESYYPPKKNLTPAMYVKNQLQYSKLTTCNQQWAYITKFSSFIHRHLLSTSRIWIKHQRRWLQKWWKHYFLFKKKKKLEGQARTQPISQPLRPSNDPLRSPVGPINTTNRSLIHVVYRDQYIMIKWPNT